MMKKIFKKKLNYEKQKVIWGIIFLLPWLIGFIFIFMSSMFDSILYSLSNVHFVGGNMPADKLNEFISSLSGTVIKKQGIVLELAGLKNYIYVLFKHASFNQVLVESAVDTIINLPVILIFSLIIAVMLNTKFKGNVLARAIFFLPVIIASDAVTSALSNTELVRQTMNGEQVPFFGNFQLQEFLIESGINKTIVEFLASVVDRIFDIISYSGVQIIILLAGLQSIPSQLYEAAKIEGATPYESFWKITIPMVSPQLLTTGVYTIVDSFLRSPVTELVIDMKNNMQYGYSSAMAWLYFGTIMVILGIFILIANKGVFYYDE